MSIAQQQKRSLMRRRSIALVAVALVIAILGVSLALVLDYVDTVTFVDVDEQKYYIRKQDGVYGMYNRDKSMLDRDEQYGYYITAAGTLVSVDAESGTYETVAVVDTVGTETVGTNSKILIFPHIKKSNILSVEVNNSYGKYSFSRRNANMELDKNSDFVIDSSPTTPYDLDLFGTLYVCAGYTLSTLKIQEPIKDANGEFSEYGLVPQVRTRYVLDGDTGEQTEQTEQYNYVPASCVITDTSGNSHKLIIGDALVTGGGYYVQYVDISTGVEQKRDAVYVLDNTVGTTILAPIEDYVTPMLCYPMNSNNYYDVENFTISEKTDGAGPSDSQIYNKKISFTYVDINDRFGTLAASAPYLFSLELDGYYASDASINSCLYNFYSPSLVGIKEFMPSNATLEKYGLYTQKRDESGKVVTNQAGEPVYIPFSSYTVEFNYDILDDNNQYSSTVHQLIFVSDIDYEETGNYYTYTIVSSVTKADDGTQKVTPMYSYDMITEVAGHVLDFLKWDEYDWINTSYINPNVAFVENITVTSPEYSANFKLDNSLSSEKDPSDSSNISVSATDSMGGKVNTLGMFSVVDKNMNLWNITASDIKVYSTTTGNELQMKGDVAYYDYNTLGKQVLCRNGYIECSDRKIEVTANRVRVIYNDGTEESLLRYETEIFRSFYQTLLYASIIDSYELSDAEEAALIGDESNLLLTLTIKTRDADGTVAERVYKYYKLSSRKAYLTINGNGGFYVQRGRVDKFISDSQRFFAGQAIDPMAKS